MVNRGRAVSPTSSSDQDPTQNQSSEVFSPFGKKRRVVCSSAYVSDSDPDCSYELGRRSFLGNSKLSSECKRNEKNAICPKREGLRPCEESRTTTLEESCEIHRRAPVPTSIRGGNDVVNEHNVLQAKKNEGQETEKMKADKPSNGGRRYSTRTRTQVKRFSPTVERPPLNPQSQSQSHPSTARFRDGIQRNHKNKRIYNRPHLSQVSFLANDSTDDSDDSLMIDEIIHVPGTPGRFMRGSPNNSKPHAELDLSVFCKKGLNSAASGWAYQANRCVFPPSTGIQRTGLSHKNDADIQPVKVDDSVDFNQVGGLSKYIRSLKEMVYLPLLYPSFFEKYGIAPARGVLLCGLPGTGKTLVARALASSVLRAGVRINFYMRKGADLLSKWVGESERQLRMLFEEAQRNQPSIIFFDEIDGLAPARSSKQEQIHNSIVSTLLALMDGLDSRGQVVVIGATNRIDAIDGALRRPGRFDREFFFTLPDCEARREILNIHTENWQDPPSEELRSELAAACVGYCGADLKALCTEAAVSAFRRTYPQVYASEEKLLLDSNAVEVTRTDFLEAMSIITPAGQRGVLVHSKPLSSIVSPCLAVQLRNIMSSISKIFPLSNADSGVEIPGEHENGLLATFTMSPYGSFPSIYKPRVLLCGKEGCGLEHLGPAVLHKLERFAIHSLALSSLLSGLSSRTAEEAVINAFMEARKTTPAVLYLPQLELWWENAHTQLRVLLLMLVADLPSNLPILLLATSHASSDELDTRVVGLFGKEVYDLGLPTPSDRRNFFSQLVEDVLHFILRKHDKTKKLECFPELTRVPKKAREPSEAELQAQADSEEHALRCLRMCLRDVCNRILYEKCFSPLHFPVEKDNRDYHSIIKNPMDVSTLLERVDNKQYLTLSAFLQDLELIPVNAKVYHGNDYKGSRIVSKANALRDAAHGMLSQIDEHLVARCDEIATQRRLLKVGREETVSTPKAVMDQPLHTTVDCSYLGGSWPKLTKSQMCEVDPEHSKCIRVGKNEGESETVASGHEHVTTTSKSENYSAVPTKETAAASCVFPKLYNMKLHKWEE